jgi:hypothetical protein
MRYLTLIIAIILIPAFALAGGQYQRPTSKEKETKVVEPDIEVYSGNGAPEPFVIIGEIHVKGGSEKHLMKEMRSKARKRGADAVLKYKIEGMIFDIWAQQQVNHASGVVVRWAHEGENGITEIKNDTPIPVLQ